MILFPKRRCQRDGVGSEADGCWSTASAVRCNWSRCRNSILTILRPYGFGPMPRIAGVSDDGKKVSAILVQLGRRKPLLKKTLGGAGADMQEAKCGAPIWQRAPSRVTFEPKGEQKFTV